MDLKLFEYIYNRYVDELLQYAMRYCGNLPQSQALVKDVFLSLWERHNDLTIEDEIRQYLYKAIKYKVLDFFRNETRKQLLMEELRIKACDFHCFNKKSVNFNEVQKLIGHAVEKMPCRCRQVYVMSVEQGLKNKDIAGKLSISEKTVEQHLTKALKYIRQNLSVSPQK